MSKKYSDIFESNCFLTKLIYFIGHSYMFHCMSGIEGGGQDTVAKKYSDIFESNCFLTKLIYFIGHSYMFHCMSGIEGGGQDTVAWVS